MIVAIVGLLLLASEAAALDAITGTLYSPFNQKCMDVHDDGIHITSTDCSEDPNHMFTLDPVDGEYYQIKSQENGKCMAVQDGTAFNAKLIVQLPCESKDHFYFKLEGPVSRQFIKAKSSNKCIRIGTESEVGRHLMQWTCNAPRQQDVWCVGACSNLRDEVMLSPPATPIEPITPDPEVVITEKSAGGRQDPHFQSWDGVRFDFHGACDLAMIQSDTFGHGDGLDVHIRTKLRDKFSYIESVAVKIGDDVFEVRGNDYSINGNPDIPLPYKLAGKYQVQLIPSGVRGNKEPFFVVSLLKNSRLTIGAFREFLLVWVFGNGASFGDSVGLLGEYHTGGFFARDGMTPFLEGDDLNAYGSEWQVKHGHDPQILSNPHESAKECTFPSQPVASGRKLAVSDPKLFEAAESACEDQYDHPDDVDACIFDVMVTGDLDMATADQPF